MTVRKLALLPTVVKTAWPCSTAVSDVLGLRPERLDADVMKESERRKALGDWGEGKALELLNRPQSEFKNAKNVNGQTHNHPFGDIYAERGRNRFLIGVKTRNKYQQSGPLNLTFNVRKKGFDVYEIAKRYNAELVWIAIQVIPELQTFKAFFGTIIQIEERGERFSIPMRPEDTTCYQRLGSEDEVDATIHKEWSNGGYSRSR